MSLCVNPHCPHPKNADNVLRCSSCGSNLLLEGQYRVTHQLGEGGFAKTYEVSARDRLPKVLKVLIKNSPKAVELFKREAEVLCRLNILGVPKAEEYFTFTPGNSQEPVHCFVMQKIEGENLQDWMSQRNNQPIGEKKARLWLEELVHILSDIHENQLFHRDIKPSNIMLSQDGLLVLIDFGTVREISDTYESKHAAKQITTIHTPGYAPLEQFNGQASPQSDFFALGRTFVYLLTGKHPADFNKPYEHDLYTDDLENWRDEAPHVSPAFADFIDQLMAQPLQKRFADTKAILQRLNEVDEILHPPVVITWERYQLQRKLQKMQRDEELLSDIRQLSQHYFERFSNVQSALGNPINWQKVAFDRTLGDLSSGHSASVRCMAISPDGQLLVSGGDDRIVKVWNINEGEEIYTLIGHSASVISVAISPDGETLASASTNQTIRLWNLKTGQEIKALLGHSKPITCVAFHPKKNSVLFSGSLDTTVSVWNLETAQITRTYARHTNGVTCLAVHPNGQIIASGSHDCNVIVWSKYTLAGHSAPVLCVVISPDGQTLVSGSQDKEIKVWNLSNGELLRTLTGHSAPVLSLVMSPDGQTLVSGSEDTTIKVWNLETGEEIKTLAQNLGSVTSLAISFDGQLLVSANEDFSIKLWK
ncbi:serine/threonine-protein kinase [Microcoleus sp. Pol10D4]|uniref:serine/threonine-protein kinase n=1 Tax=Microcoleus sp. Pol10D4 TaxID=3055387 RepID=UPI002FD1D356